MVLASRPGVGKTTFALNIAYNLAMNNLSIAYYSLEFSGKQLASSILCGAGGVTDEKIASGEIDDRSINGLLNAAKIISDKRLFFYNNPDLTTTELANKCKKIKDKDGLDFIIIDYLQLMHYSNDKTSFSSLKEEADNKLNDLKNFAKDLDIGIIVLSQLCSDVDLKEKPDVSDFRESSGVEKYANTILLLSRKNKLYAKEF